MKSKETGIYKLIHSAKPEHCYIGSASKGFSIRWSSHKGQLKRGKHCCTYLQNVVNKHGLSGLRMEILEVVNLPKDELRVLEQKYINDYLATNSRDKLYNSTLSTRCTTDDPEIMKKQKLAAKKNGHSQNNLDRLGKYNNDPVLQQSRIEALKAAKCRKVLCVELNIVFDSSAEAGKYIVESNRCETDNWQHPASSIAKCRKGRHNHKAYGLTWLPLEVP